MTHDCAHRGHHWHEVDGCIFSRKRLRTETTLIPVHCCHCDAVTSMTGYSPTPSTARESMIACREPAAV